MRFDQQSNMLDCPFATSHLFRSKRARTKVDEDEVTLPCQGYVITGYQPWMHLASQAIDLAAEHYI